MNPSVRHVISNTNWPLVGGLVFFFTVVMGLVVGYQRSVDWLMDEKQVPLRYVVVSGELQHSSREQITQVVMTKGLGSFFNVDVNAVQQRIEALPWIYQASVRKQWPDVLTVFVVEQQPAAIWNDNLLLNTKGDYFSAVVTDETEGLLNLPSLHGPQGSHKDALKGYQDLNRLLAINGFAVSELTLSARFSWQLGLKNGVVLLLGREEKVKRVQRFIDLYSVITAHKEQAVLSVDLRYDTGMAVRWADDDKKGEKNS
ncbi:MAG: cell division protein FtsQ [Phenylobacterium sp.]|jgi:cell division protein FtsQ